MGGLSDSHKWALKSDTPTSLTRIVGRMIVILEKETCLEEKLTAREPQDRKTEQNVCVCVYFQYISVYLFWKIKQPFNEKAITPAQ